nr:MAG TPA: hypothetical protein [Caudoviricetes sp.]
MVTRFALLYHPFMSYYSNLCRLTALLVSSR